MAKEMQKDLISSSEDQGTLDNEHLNGVDGGIHSNDELKILWKKAMKANSMKLREQSIAEEGEDREDEDDVKGKCGFHDVILDIVLVL